LRPGTGERRRAGRWHASIAVRALAVAANKFGQEQPTLRAAATWT